MQTKKQRRANIDDGSAILTNIQRPYESLCKKKVLAELIELLNRNPETRRILELMEIVKEY